jgi:hypothetical protein
MMWPANAKVSIPRLMLGLLSVWLFRQWVWMPMLLSGRLWPQP